MLFSPGERVRYDGRDMEKFGLKDGMVGEIVRCHQSSVEVYYKDLQRVVHFMDFHMRTSLKRLPPATAQKKERRSPLMLIIVLIAAAGVIAAIVMFILKNYR